MAESKTTWFNGWFGETTLWDACRDGKLSKVAKCLNKKPELLHSHLEKDPCYTPFQIAALHGRVDVMRFLVEKGADPNVIDAENRTPIHLAVMGGHLPAVVYLLNEVGVVHTSKDIEGRTPLDIAKLGTEDEKKKKRMAALEILHFLETYVKECDKKEHNLRQKLLIESIDTGMADFSCPICFDLLYKPVTVLCGHTMCKYCLDRTLLDEMRCPVCSAPCPHSHMLKSNILLSEIIELNYPLTTKRRMKENEAVQRETVTLHIGNEHKVLQVESANKHSWKFFIRRSDDGDVSRIVDKVDVKLHHSFSPNSFVLTRPPFEVDRVGWGLFTIQGIIHFKPHLNHYPVNFQHQLNFSAPETYNAISLTFYSIK